MWAESDPRPESNANPSPVQVSDDRPVDLTEHRFKNYQIITLICFLSVFDKMQKLKLQYMKNIKWSETSAVSVNINRSACKVNLD